MYLEPRNHKIATVLLAVLLLSGLIIANHIAVPPAIAADITNHQPEYQSTALPENYEGTPSLLLTPISTLDPNEETSKPGALFATVLLLMCGMVGMLIAGVGIAIVMVRLRTRTRP